VISLSRCDFPAVISAQKKSAETVCPSIDTLIVTISACIERNKKIYISLGSSSPELLMKTNCPCIKFEFNLFRVWLSICYIMFSSDFSSNITFSNPKKVKSFLLVDYEHQ
jgi:hypothetical protein